MANDRFDFDHIPAGLRRGAPFIILALALLFIAGLVVVPRAYAARYAGQIFPGVTASGIALGGLDETDAIRRVNDSMPLFSGTLVLRDAADGRTWELDASELGLGIGAEGERPLDPQVLVEAAMRAGRNPALGNIRRFADQLRIRRSGLDVAPPLGFDEESARATLDALVDELNVPPVNARVEREGNDLRDVRSNTGRSLDMDATLAALRGLAQSPYTNTLNIATQPVAARVRDLSNVSDAFNLITGSDLIMNWREGQTYTIDAETLQAWTSLEDVQSDTGDVVPAIIIDRAAIREWLTPLTADINHGERDARYVIDQSSGRFVLRSESLSGTILDVEASIERVIEAAYTEQRIGELAVRLPPPKVNSELTGLLNSGLERTGSVSISFAGAPPERMQNLLSMVDRFNGLTLAPGQTFSFLRELDPASPDSGLDPTQMLVNISDPESLSDETLTGGVAQIATALFRNAFWAGLPILERHAPPVRIGWLEPPVGMDASVSASGRDLRFTNDSDSYMVFVMGLDTVRSVLRSELYSLPMARDISVVGPEVAELEPAADANRRSDPRLGAGLAQQIGWAREGASAVVERRVSQAGEARPADVFVSTYRPAGDVVVVGR